MDFYNVIFAASEKMDAFVTYRQDSVVQKNDIDTTLKSVELIGAVNVEDSVSVEQTTKQEGKDLTKKKVYTNAQIRSWRLQQEKKLLIGTSKYIAPRTNIDFSFTETAPPGVVLPIRERNSGGSDWLTLIIFLGIFLLATVRYAYAKYIAHLFLSLFNHATSVRMFQEKSYPIFHGAFRLEAIFYIGFSVFVFQALNISIWKNDSTHPSYFLMVLGIVLLYFFVKKFLYLLAGSMFESLPETREYLFNIDNFNRSLGIILLPIVILVSFAPIERPVFIVYLGLAVVAIFNLLLLQRGIFILLKKQFSIFYLFLYLCTLEFLPLLLILKVVVE